MHSQPYSFLWHPLACISVWHVQAGHLPPSLLAFPPPQNPQQNPMTQNSMAGNPMAAAAAAAHAAHFAAGNPNANSNANPHTHARIVSGALAALSPYQAQLQGLPLMHAPPAFPFLAQGDPSLQAFLLCTLP